MKINHLLFAFCMLVFTSFGFAAEFTVEQKNKKFMPDSITVKVGDTINFLNGDDFFHNVFSLSDAQLFDLGSYPKGESKPVVFVSAGVLEIECAIHPDMIMTVTVEP